MQINSKTQVIFSLQKLIPFILIFAIYFKASAQENTIKPVTPKELRIIIDSVSTIVKRYYVKPKIGNQIARYIRDKHEKGSYNSLTDPKVLKDSLKKDLKAINGDLHMGLIYKSPEEISTNKKASTRVNRSGLWSNYGLSEIKVLNGNIGYLKIKHFTQHQFLENIKPIIQSAFESLKNTDALIIDVRDNGGGFEDMVAHYISYFFDNKTPIHLSDYRCTLHNHTYGISTNPNVLGTKLPKIKLYVLVNANTGSAAESFAYMLKHLGRATIIGETTIGAGNGASQHKINKRFNVQVSSEETINAITKTSFEKVGVVPNIKTTSEQSFHTGYKLALEYARENNRRNIHPSNYDKLISFIPSPEKSNSNHLEDYQNYVGNYKGGDIEISITLENNTLYGQPSNRSKMKLTQLDKHIFKVGDINERIQFILDKEGNVVLLEGIDSPMKLTKLSKN